MLRITRTGTGFTLVEMIISIAIFSTLSLVLTSVIANMYRFNAYTLEQAYEVNHARRGIERTVRDIREMTYGENGAYPLVEMGTSTIAFYSDIDRDESVEFIRYRLQGTLLYKYVYNATGTPITYSATPDETYLISEYVRNNTQATSTFRYFTETSAATATTSIADIRYIVVTAIINVDPNRNPGEFTLRSSAAPRNLKTTF